MILPLLKRALSDKVLILLAISILILIGLRIAILPFSPPGFYVDEAATGAHVVAMVIHHTNAYGQAWPLYSQSLGGGFTTPIYLYPLSIWASIFGFSEVALRYFSQFVTIMSIIVIGVSMRLWIDKKAGLIAIIVGLALPWGWLQGSIAWDPAMVPLMISLAIIGWSLLMTRTTTKARLTGRILLPASLIGLAYLYPPYWVSAPIIFLATYFNLYIKKRISIRHIVYTLIGSIILSIPLINFILQPNTLLRSSNIGIFHGVSFIQSVEIFIDNILLFINPTFLFTYGDANLRHSTGYQGMLGLGALIPIVFLIWFAIEHYNKNKIKFLKPTEIFLVSAGLIGFIISLIGSALTNEGQPQSLRSCAAWPFAIIVITIGWCAITRYKNQWIKWFAIILFVIGTLAYASDLAFNFPNRGSSAFYVPERTNILNNQKTNYPDLVLKYYSTR